MQNLIIIDYKMGNLFSVKQACEHLGFKAQISSQKVKISQADALILPGVGAFGDAMINLKKLDLIQVIKSKIQNKTPLFGICLGFQLLFEKSYEFGEHQGLNLIKGEVKKIPENKNLRIPNIGWNSIDKKTINWHNTPFAKLKNHDYMYFIHSYFVKPKDPNLVLGQTNYNGFEFCSAILKDNIFAVQFHPEKSGQKGISIYQQWLERNL